jgi:hypothetical protein
MYTKEGIPQKLKGMFSISATNKNRESFPVGIKSKGHFSTLTV